MEKFFDSHLHATLKHQFANKGKEVSAWETLTPKKYTDNFNGFRGKLTKYFLMNFIINTLRSQSSLSQLIEGKYGLCIMALYSPDRELLNSLYSNPAFNDIIKREWFGQILDKEKLESLINGTEHFPILLKDLKLLKEPSTKGEVVFLNQKADFKDQDKVLNLVFSIEGLHCLRTDATVTDPAGVVAQLNSSLDQIKANGGHVISSTITHIDNENQLFANQAYALDGIRNMGLSDEKMRPTGNGLTPLGKEAVSVLETRGIFPDIKHLSYKARKDFYKWRADRAVTSPIVCTHAGLAGIAFQGNGKSYQDLIITAKKVKTRYPEDGNTIEKDHVEVTLAKLQSSRDTHFNTVGYNSTSINLYDEDVRQIYDSNGFMGISLDVRILGYSKLFREDWENEYLNYVVEFVKQGQTHKLICDTEFFSWQEFQDLGLQLTGPELKFSQCIHYENLKDQIGGKGNSGFYAQYQHFLANVLHAVRLGESWDGATGIEKMLLETIGIGSDFDGLIDSIWYASDCTQIDYLKKRVTKDFRRAAKQFGINLPNSISNQVVADHIFYLNGKNFVLKHI